MSTKDSTTLRCEGYRRYGGALTLGPVRWEQCRENAIVMLEIEQDDERQKFPACKTCWDEARKTKGISIINTSSMPK